MIKTNNMHSLGLLMKLTDQMALSLLVLRVRN